MFRKRNQFIVLLSSICLSAIWLFVIFDTLDSFYYLSFFDSLALIKALFPRFWIILLVFGLLCIFTIFFGIDNKMLHILLLNQFSIILFYTPFLVSGFSWSPDSLWHGGIAYYISDILFGFGVNLSNYAYCYPISFITSNIIYNIFGINVFEYTLYFYPILFIIMFTSLSYIYCERVLDSKTAFLTMILSLPSLHYIEPHVSPFSYGTILVLLSFCLLTVLNKQAKILFLFNTFVLILTHPISPISLLIFLIAVVILKVLLLKAFSYKISSNLDIYPSFSIILIITISWLTWTIFRSIDVYNGIRYAFLNILTLRLFSRITSVSEWTLGGHSFIHNDITILTLFIYGIFLISILLLAFYDLYYLIRSSISHYKSYHSSYKRIIFSIVSILFAIFSYNLFLASGERFLLGRGLVFFIMMASICISIYFVSDTKMKIFKYMLTIIIFMLLIISFPFISYSKESYNSYTLSSNTGLTFLSNKVDLTKYSLSMGADQQLASYANLSKGLILSKFPPNMSKDNPNFIVLRINSYFSFSMRYDLSFENNTFTQLKNEIETNYLYNKIYSNFKFDMYSNAK